MSKAGNLIKYNIDYYIRSAKYLPPVIAYVIFLALNYQVAPIGIWSNLHITLLAIFILSGWIGANFINSEDKTQQSITKLHIDNDYVYHLTKIVSILAFLIPFYAITLLVPIVSGSFTRGILFGEILVYIAVYILIGLLGIMVGALFNSNIFKDEIAILVHLAVLALIVIPFGAIYAENRIVVVAHRLLPPVNFLAQRLQYLDCGAFAIDGHFWLFALNSIAYIAVLVALYVYLMRKKSGYSKLF